MVASHKLFDPACDISVPEAARALGTSKDAVRVAIARGKIPSRFVRCVCGHPRRAVSREWLDQMVAELTQHPLRTEEVAARYGVTTARVQNARVAGKVAARKIRGRWRFAPGDLPASWPDQRRRKGPSRKALRMAGPGTGYMTATDAIALLGVSRQRLNQLVHGRVIRCKRVHRKCGVYLRADVEARLANTLRSASGGV